MKTYIYEIACKTNLSLFYIGSTNNLSSRQSHHKKNTTNKVGKRYWTKLYTEIRANGGWVNMKFTKLYEFDDISKDELRQKEQYYIDELKPPLNSIKSYKHKKLTITTKVLNISNFEIEEMYTDKTI